MKDEIRKNLIDIIQAGEEIQQFTHDMDFKTYRNSPITQRAVERNFEIIGEALNRIKRMDDKFLARVSGHNRNLSYRADFTQVRISQKLSGESKNVWRTFEESQNRRRAFNEGLGQANWR